MKFESISGRKCALSPDELAELCEMFVTGQMDIFQLAHRHDMSVATIDRYLDKFYYGFVPKKYQSYLVLPSKMNTDDP